MKEEIYTFRYRAIKFDDASKEFFKKEVFDLSAFHIEQAFQLYLKYILAKEFGYFPRTRSLYTLFKELSSINSDFWKFFEENEVILKDVGDAYFLARYFPRDYSKNEVEQMLEVLENFKVRFSKWIL